MSSGFPAGSLLSGPIAERRRHTRTRKSRRWCVRPRPRRDEYQEKKISRRRHMTEFGLGYRRPRRDGWGYSQRVEILAELYPGAEAGEGEEEKEKTLTTTTTMGLNLWRRSRIKPFPFSPRERVAAHGCALVRRSRSIETNHPRGFADDDAIARSIAIGVAIGTVDTRVVASGYARVAVDLDA